MKRKTWMGILCAASASLAVTLLGCGSDMTGDPEQTAEAKGAFSFYTEDACVVSCAGGQPDGVCAASENAFNCAQDCACGDGRCDGSETTSSCPVDCKFGSDPGSDVDDFCGNTRCEPWEVDQNGILCPQDCKLAAQDPPGTLCGDYTCSPGETSATCPADCGNTALCGNGSCDASRGETSATCDADCTNFNVPAGRFLGTECVGYALYAKYANGSGGYDQHLVTPVAAACNGAAPWKVDSNVGICNGSTLLKPDGTLCTIQGAACTTDINSWASLGSTYLMPVDPNKCNTYTTGTGSFQPVEWSKSGSVTCSAASPCAIRQCNGQTSNQINGSVGAWTPKLAPWTIYAKHCQ